MSNIRYSMVGSLNKKQLIPYRAAGVPCMVTLANANDHEGLQVRATVPISSALKYSRISF